MFEYMVEHYDFQAPDTPLTKFYKKDIYDYQYLHLDGHVNDEKQTFQSENEAADLISEFAWSAGASLVGFTGVKDHFVFDSFELDPSHKFAVVIAFEMDFDLVNTAPEAPSGIEVLRAYWRLGQIIIKVAEFIRFLGYSARAHHPRSFIGQGPTLLHSAAALEAGLGEVGRMGLLITEEFGPRVRVATVTTELPLPQFKRKTFGVEKYCETCHACRDACEGDAIPEEKSEVRCILKYTIDPYKCLPYFAKYDGCNLCVSKCPFNKKPL
jgi:epoxyqueuosine reductase QueG